ncbi:MAG: LptF/LptG family permease, partial [Chlamydiia bacterium]|nr:LptF/LptG family permease [Chlamydiia bacterium]
ILPIALPIASVVAAILLYQRLSTTHEITALRASGMSLGQIVGPVLLASIYLTIGNLYLISEVATASHLETRRMEHKIKTLSPMVLLQHRQLLRHRGAYIDVLGTQDAHRAESVIVAASNRSQGRTNLGIIKELSYENDTLRTVNASLITSMPSDEEDSFDHLLIENIGHTETPALAFTQQMKNEGWRLSHDHLNMSLLLVRLMKEREALYKAIDAGIDGKELDLLNRAVSRCYSEISRRFSLAFALFSFTLMGISFGIDISRNHSKKGVLIVVALAALYLTAFFIAKAKEHVFLLSTSLLLVPHILIVGLSVRTLRLVNAGIEQ